MGNGETAKGTELFCMFQDYWQILKTFWNVQDSDEYWKNLVDATDKFYGQYETEYAKDLTMSLLNELERKAKNE